MKDYNQIEELVDRAMQPEDELLPLTMPGEDTSTMQVYTAPAEKKPQPNEAEEDDELEGKSTRQVLISALVDDEDEHINFTLPHVLRGDILTTRWLRQQIWWLVMVVGMAFFYVSNRYYAQKQMINNNHLKEELKEMHYDAMARSSQLMRNSRRSIIVDKLISSNSTLTMPERQPAAIE